MNTTVPYTNIHAHQLCCDEAVCLLNIEVGQKLSTPAFFSAGIHPWRIATTNIPEALATLEKMASLNNMLAIGECGLDRIIDVAMPQQEMVFKEQLLLAEKYQKPVIIHCVRAFDELLRIKKATNYSVPFIIHGFNTNIQIAEQLIRKGCILSFGKALLQENSNAQQVFKTLNPELFFLETDNSDIGINTIFEKAAALKELELEALKEKLYTNFKNILKA